MFDPKAWGNLTEQGYQRSVKLMQTFDRVRKGLHVFHPAPPLKPSEAGMLGTIEHLASKEGKPVTVGKLARFTRQSMPGVSQKISALEEHGYLRRLPDKTDRRVVMVEVTAKGRTYSRRNFGEFMRKMEEAMEHLGDEKSDQLLQLLQELGDAMERQKSEPENTQERTEDT